MPSRFYSPSSQESTQQIQQQFHQQYPKASPSFSSNHHPSHPSHLDISFDSSYDFASPETGQQTLISVRSSMDQQQRPTMGDDLDSESSTDSHNDLDTKWSWKSLKREFKLSHSESLFHLYQAKLQHSFFVALLILNIIFYSGAIISHSFSIFLVDKYMIIMKLASIFVFASFLALIWFNKLWLQSKFSRSVASLAVLMAMIFGEASVAICALVNGQSTPLGNIRRTYFLIITNHVFLPFPTRYQACGATIIIASLEICVTYISREQNNCIANLTAYTIADVLFYGSSAMIGFQITFLLEIAIRRTFLNHKYCIQSTYKLNYEKEQQEQLLRSCFPQHLIEQIREEIRESIALINKRQSVPFKPFYNLYVEKYENVSILYADIVNSMNLTDKLKPDELVETLNELYGRFDESAEKYSCLRIKLLGDCYYCISGLPEYEDDHAMKCLLMGLEMINIINSIRESRNVDIDMRIGIHSGSVLSGLIGLRKWQFDIWSYDAMRASRMEHNGQPGFVHITQETLDLLPEDHIRRKDLIITSTRQSDTSETTYLISERMSSNQYSKLSPQAERCGQTEKLKAYIEKLRVRSTGSAMDFTQRRMALETSLRKYREIHEKVDETMKRAIADMPLGSAWKKFFFIDCFGRRNSIGNGGGGGLINCRQAVNDTHAILGSSSGSNYNGIISSINDDKSPSPSNRGDCFPTCSSQSKRDKSDKAAAKRRLEAAKQQQLLHKQKSQHRQSQLSAAAAASATSRSKTSPRSSVQSPLNKALDRMDPLFHLYLICVGLITLSILGIKALIQFSNGMTIFDHTWIGFGFLLAIILGSNFYTLVISNKIKAQFRICLWAIISVSLTLLQLLDLLVLGDSNLDEQSDSQSCAFAWYYTFTIIVGMTATSIFIRINVWLKFMLHMATIMAYIFINNPPSVMLDSIKKFLKTPGLNWSILDNKQDLSHLFYIIMIAVILHLIDRQVEYILSLNIQWNEQLESDRVESETVGQINRILLENILPPHVLKRYLYNASVSYDQLYHESHPSCAVMFASIPNYESFYTENNLNEQGLKCLQLLNEIICDFDQLLSHPAFRSIEKIKTIGSTYMAACFDVSRRYSDSTLWDPEDQQHDQSMGDVSSFRSPPLTSAAAAAAHGWSNPLMYGCQYSNAGSSCATPSFSHRVIGPAGSQHLPYRARSTSHQDLNAQWQSSSMLMQDMANCGDNDLEDVEISNVVTMVCFATALMENLARINRDAFQEFKLRIGIAIGPVIAGVVGATKPTYDIWGDTVNVASRLESSGILGRIQVTEQVARILINRDQFEVECRGPIEVKGKGLLTTYLVVTPNDSGCSESDSSPVQAHPQHPQPHQQQQQQGTEPGEFACSCADLADSGQLSALLPGASAGPTSGLLQLDASDLAAELPGDIELVEPPVALESEHDGDRAQELGADSD